MPNKIKYGIQNAHFAPYTVGDDGTITYDTPIPLPGSVELSLEPRGDMIEFYADNMLYYSGQNNQGYDGTLTIARLTEAFATIALGEEKDSTDNVITEKSTAKGKPFAFLFQFEGDVKATRHVLYNCTANRPTVNGTTRTDSVEPDTDEMTFVASARDGDYAVKTKTTEDTPDEIYNNWFKQVYQPSDQGGGGALG